MAYDDRLRVEAKLEDPKVALGDGDVDSDNVSSVRGSKGVAMVQGWWGQCVNG